MLLHIRGRNGEDGVVGAGVGVGVVAVAEEARIVVVEQVVVAGIAIGLHGMRKRLQVIHDGGNTWLRHVCAVGVGAAAVGWRAVGAAAVAVFGVPVVGADGGIGIFDFVHDAGVRGALANFDVVRRHQALP